MSQSFICPLGVTPSDVRGFEVRPRFFSQIFYGNKDESVLPNLSNWLPGDVLLFSAPFKGPRLGDPLEKQSVNLIERYQRLTSWASEPEHTRWVHAGLYVGWGTYIEALPKQGVAVLEGALPRRLSSGLVRVRRMLVKQVGSTGQLEKVGEDNRADVVTAALFGLGAEYAYAQLLDHVRDSLGRSRTPGDDQALQESDQALPAAYICSGLVATAIQRALNIRIAYGPASATPKNRRHPPLPAELSACKELHDVEVFWSREMPP